MTFSEAFRQHVVPDIQRLCRVHGLFLALDRTTFTDAYDEVMSVARRRGAGHLPPNSDPLEDWIMRSILLAEAEFRPEVEATRAMANKVAADIARCEAAWLTMA